MTTSADIAASELMHAAADECMSPDQRDLFDQLGYGDKECDVYARLFRCILKRASTALTTGSAPEINQCDGCRANAPLTEQYGNHVMPDGGFMACTKDRYAAPPANAPVVSDANENLRQEMYKHGFNDGREQGRNEANAPVANLKGVI
jgi:hypothetical protein